MIRSSTGLRPAKPSLIPCQWEMVFSPSFQQSRMSCPSTSQGQSSRPISSAFAGENLAAHFEVLSLEPDGLHLPHRGLYGVDGLVPLGSPRRHVYNIEG